MREANIFRQGESNPEDLSAEVRINVGIMFFDGRDLKSQRGKVMVLSIKKCANEGLTKGFLREAQSAFQGCHQV